MGGVGITEEIGLLACRVSAIEKAPFFEQRNGSILRAEDVTEEDIFSHRDYTFVTLIINFQRDAVNVEAGIR